MCRFLGSTLLRSTRKACDSNLSKEVKEMKDITFKNEEDRIKNGFLSKKAKAEKEPQKKLGAYHPLSRKNNFSSLEM